MGRHTDPIARFRASFERARAKESGDASACALATADASGKPAVRMVLLKAVDDGGFVFYTNYGSRKSAELGANPRASLCFNWPGLGEQIRVEGRVERTSEEESDAYFASRGRMSQIGAWASRQSEPLASRRTLIGQFLKQQARFAGQRVRRPESWGGFRLIPERMEFWSTRSHRLHDRLQYLRQQDGWVASRLYP